MAHIIDSIVINNMLRQTLRYGVCSIENVHFINLLEKWFPLQGERACWSFQKLNREEWGTEQQPTYQFTQGYNILSTYYKSSYTII